MSDRPGLWSEYDSAADWCAARGLRGVDGDPLPFALSADVLDAINADPEAFAQRVRGCAYALAMAPIDARQES